MRGLLALLVLLAAFAVIVAFTAIGDDSAKTSTPTLLARATPPAPGPTPPSPPTGVPLRSGNMFAGPPIALPPVPTPQPGREGPETTLVEVSTGRSLRLWTAGEVIARSTFSHDGKWLVYDRVKDNVGSLYRVDLGQADLKATLYSDGLAPSFSANDDLSFLTTRRESLNDGGEDIRVLTAAGQLRTLPPSAYGLPVWSPDGRWLAYVAPTGTAAIGEPIALMVYDSRSGRTQKLGEGPPVQGDYRLGPEWSPTGRYVSQAFSGNLRVDRRVFSPSDTEFVRDVPDRAVWAAAQDVLLALDAATDPPTYVSIDVASGRTTPLGVEGTYYLEPTASPDGRMFAVMREARPDGSQTYGTRFASTDSGAVVFETSGVFSAWSPDGSSLLLSHAPECALGYSLRDAATGAERRCLGDTTAAKYSPSGKLVAYVQPQLSTAGPRFLGQPYLVDPRYMETMSNDLYVLDLASGQSRKVLTDARGPLSCIRWSPDERWLVLTAICDGV